MSDLNLCVFDLFYNITGIAFLTIFVYWENEISYDVLQLNEVNELVNALSLNLDLKYAISVSSTIYI